jgi:uncharacterized membrane protein YfcA
VDLALAVFVVLVLVGGYVQTVAGFAMGMILVAGSSALGLYCLPVTTAVISLVSLLNIVLSLGGHLDRVHRRAFLWMALGQVPFIAVGVALLEWLDADAERALGVLLGTFILLGCASMMMRPEPKATVSSRPASCSRGSAAASSAACSPRRRRSWAGSRTASPWRWPRSARRCWPASRCRRSCARAWWGSPAD